MLLVIVVGCRWPSFWRNWRAILDRGLAQDRLDTLVAACLVGVLGVLFWPLYRSRMIPNIGGTIMSGGSCWADLPIHMHIAEAFLQGRNADISWGAMASPVFAGEHLYYPFLPDFHAAVMKQLGCELGDAFHWTGWLMAGSLWAFLYFLTVRVTRSRLGGLLAVVITIGAGGMGGPSFIWNKGWGEALAVDTAQNDITMGYNIFWFAFMPHVLLPQRGANFAYPMVLLVLLLVWRASDASLRIALHERRSLLIHAAAFAALLPMVQAHAFVGLAIMMAVYFVLDAHKWLADLRLLLAWGTAGLVAAAVGYPQMAMFAKQVTKGAGGHFVTYGWIFRSNPYGAGGSALSGFFSFWWASLGPAVPLYCVTLVILLWEVFAAWRFSREALKRGGGGGALTRLAHVYGAGLEASALPRHLTALADGEEEMHAALVAKVAAATGVGKLTSAAAAAAAAAAAGAGSQHYSRAGAPYGSSSNRGGISNGSGGGVVSAVADVARSAAALWAGAGDDDDDKYHKRAPAPRRTGTGVGGAGTPPQHLRRGGAGGSSSGHEDVVHHSESHMAGQDASSNFNLGQQHQQSSPLFSTLGNDDGDAYAATASAAGAPPSPFSPFPALSSPLGNAPFPSLASPLSKAPFPALASPHRLDPFPTSHASPHRLASPTYAQQEHQQRESPTPVSLTYEDHNRQQQHLTTGLGDGNGEEYSASFDGTSDDNNHISAALGAPGHRMRHPASGTPQHQHQQLDADHGDATDTGGAHALHDDDGYSAKAKHGHRQHSSSDGGSLWGSVSSSFLASPAWGGGPTVGSAASSSSSSLGGSAYSFHSSPASPGAPSNAGITIFEFASAFVEVSAYVVGFREGAPLFWHPANRGAHILRLYYGPGASQTLLMHFLRVGLDVLPELAVAVLDGRCTVGIAGPDRFLSRLNDLSLTGRGLDALKLSLSAGAVWAIGNYVNFQPWDRDNCKLFYIWVFVYAGFIGSLLATPIEFLCGLQPGYARLMEWCGAPYAEALDLSRGKEPGTGMAAIAAASTEEIEASASTWAPAARGQVEVGAAAEWGASVSSGGGGGGTAAAWPRQNFSQSFVRRRVLARFVAVPGSVASLTTLLLLCITGVLMLVREYGMNHVVSVRGCVCRVRADGGVGVTMSPW